HRLDQTRECDGPHRRYHDARRRARVALYAEPHRRECLRSGSGISLERDEFCGLKKRLSGTSGEQMERWTPKDIDRITADVAAMPRLQQELLERASLSLKTADRVAHQYQIAGGRVSLRIATELPSELDGVGLFKPNADYTGIGRISTGLGCPHNETYPDFLGLRLAFL